MLTLSSILGAELLPVIVSHGGYRTMIQEEGTLFIIYID